MRAALPYVDDFLPAHNLDSLFALGRALESVDDRRHPERRGAAAAHPTEWTGLAHLG
jgi:hypothetical protein